MHTFLYSIVTLTSLTSAFASDLEEQPNITYVPADVFSHHIDLYLPLEDVRSLRLSCKHFDDLYKSARVWITRVNDQRTTHPQAKHLDPVRIRPISKPHDLQTYTWALTYLAEKYFLESMAAFHLADNHQADSEPYKNHMRTAHRKLSWSFQLGLPDAGKFYGSRVLSLDNPAAFPTFMEVLPLYLKSFRDRELNIQPLRSGNPQIDMLLERLEVYDLSETERKAILKEARKIDFEEFPEGISTLTDNRIDLFNINFLKLKISPKKLLENALKQLSSRPNPTDSSLLLFLIMVQDDQYLKSILDSRLIEETRVMGSTCQQFFFG